MSALPAPLNTPECDLRGCEFMPVFGHKLYHSDFYQLALDNPRAGLAAQKLWWEAWRQRPAGSLMNHERALAHWADIFDTRVWRRCREIALHGFVLCSDDRLYHPVLCEAAKKAFAKIQAKKGRFNRRLEMESGEWAAIREQIFARDDYTCGYCGERGGKLECDHIQPVSKGGQSTPDNLVTACFTCNRSKAAKPVSQWRARA